MIMTIPIFLSISSHIPPHTPSQIYLFFFFDSPVSPDTAARMCMVIALSTVAW